MKVGTPLRDAAVLPDGAVLSEPPAHLPAVEAVESLNELGQPIVSVRCPFRGMTHHLGRTALPAVRYCAHGVFTVVAGSS